MTTTRQNCYGYAPTRKRGFTLVELSIVLVIVGLLVTGTLGGRELIRAAKMNKAVTEVTKLKSAYFAYMTKNNGEAPGLYRPRGDLSPCGTISASDRSRTLTGLTGEDAMAQLINNDLIPMGEDCEAYYTEYKSDFCQSDQSQFRFAYNPTFRSNVIVYLCGSTMDSNVTSPDETRYVDSKMDDGTPTTGIMMQLTTNLGASDCYTGTTYNVNVEEATCNFDVIFKAQ